MTKTVFRDEEAKHNMRQRTTTCTINNKMVLCAYLLLELEGVHVEMLLQLLVGVVDAQLLKTVEPTYENSTSRIYSDEAIFHHVAG